LHQTVFAAILVAALVFLGVFYGWRQVLALRRLRADADPTSDESFYQRRRAKRRLLNSGLMLILAGLLAGVLTLETQAEGLARERDAFAEGEAPPLTPEQRNFVYLYTGLWITFLIIFLAVVIVAAADAWSTRTFALRAFRKLHEDRRAMIERQVLRMRQDRNGH
jgi:hypothetical protein